MCLRRRQTEWIDGIEVRGTTDFRARTRESLGRLRSTASFEVIRGHLGAIRQGRRSGMKAWRKEPTFVAGGPTWRHSVLWYAGAIAHDAYHAKLYRDARETGLGRKPDADTWTGPEREKQCLRFQLEVLAELGADAETLAYVRDCLRDPTYQGRHRGWRSWLDYLKRRW